MPRKVRILLGCLGLPLIPILALILEGPLNEKSVWSESSFWGERRLGLS